MHTDLYKKEIDQCPIQPGWKHVAGVPIRRARIGPLDMDSLPGLNAAVAAMLRSRGPWINIDPVNHFLTLHGLSFGDVIDFVDRGGNVECRFHVMLEGLDLMWSSESRAVWFIRATSSSAEPAMDGHFGVVLHHEDPLKTNSRVPALSFDEHLRLAFEALRAAEVVCDNVYPMGCNYDPELTPHELVNPIGETLESVRPCFPCDLDLQSVADAICRRDNRVASRYLRGTLMVYLDNELDSHLGTEEYTPILQALLLGTRLLDLVEKDFQIGILESDFPWAGALWCKPVEDVTVSAKALLAGAFIERLDPTIQSLLALAVTTDRIGDWAKLRATIDAQLRYSRACADVARQLFLLWTIDNNLVGARAELCH